MRTKKILAFLISAVMAVQAVPMSAAAVEAEIQETAEILEEPVLLQEEPEEPEVHVIPDVMVSEKATELYAAAVVSGDFEYTVNEEGTATITGFVGEESGDLVIPDEIDGYAVTAIGNDAFFDCYGFTGSLTIGDSVTSIGDWAFGYCDGFTGSLTTGDSVTSIRDRAFYECTGFAGSLTIGDSVNSIGSPNGATLRTRISTPLVTPMSMILRLTAPSPWSLTTVARCPTFTSFRVFITIVPLFVFLLASANK